MGPELGEIYWALVEGPRPRPVVVVSRRELNQGSYVLAVPFTTARLSERWSLPNCVPFRKGRCGLDRKCVAQADAITVLAKSEFDLEGGPLGTLDAEALRGLIRAIGYVIEAECEPE